MNGSERRVGIEYLSVYGTQAFIEVDELFAARGLDPARRANLMMRRKAVNLPCEDAVTNAVNAAKPIIDRLSDGERASISLLVTSTESGIDFGKALATYVHDHLGLSRSCRVFEVKQACYGATAALQMAANQVASGLMPGRTALVIATDVARPSVKLGYAEPSQGVAAAAMLVSDRPVILDLDLGANGLCSYEVMDTCRPTAEMETGNADLSLMAYLECLDGAFADYAARVDGVDFLESFDALAFHTPFAGMVKGAHRTMMRRLKKMAPAEIDADFDRRVAPSLEFCAQVGNAYSATVFIALAGLLDTMDFTLPGRIGLFSYGSGCSSEFFSGVADARSAERMRSMGTQARLAARGKLSIPDYDRILDLNAPWLFGVKDAEMDVSPFRDIYDRQFKDRGLLVLKRIEDYHRIYGWS